MASSFERVGQEEEAQRPKRPQVCAFAMRGSHCFELVEKELHHMAAVDMYSIVS